VDRAKQIFVYLAGTAAQKYEIAIEEQQEVLGLLADTAQEIYAMESGLLRALKSIESAGEEKSKTKIAMVQLYINDAMGKVRSYAKQTLAAMESGEALDSQLTILRKISQVVPVNAVQIRRDIADRIIEAEKYTS
jgi:hypothetical protein